MQTTTVGFLLNTLDNKRFFKESIVVANKPTYKVLRFISDDDFNKQANGLMSKFLVRESLKTTAGETIVVNYVKTK